MANDETPQPTTNDIVGKQLQRAREKAGLSVNDVANVQHLRSCVIQSIENGEYSKIDTELFLKGYVRAYAKQVGLNADELISDLELELEPLRQKREQEHEANPLVNIERRRRQKRRLGKLFFVLVALVIIGYLIFTFGLGGYGGTSVGQSVASESAEEIEAEATQSDSLNNGSFNEQVSSGADETSESMHEALVTPETSLSDGTGTVAVIEAETDSEPELTVPIVTESIEPALAEPGEPPVITDTGILQITFTSDCWVQVRDATGSKLVNSLQRDGDRIDISGEMPLKVVIGAVDAVGSIRFQGEAVNMSDYSVVNNRSEFTLTI